MTQKRKIKRNNILKTQYGSYRARVQMNGVRISKNLSKLKEAKEWLRSITLLHSLSNVDAK